MTWTTASPPPDVPGFSIGARLGAGSSGSVWRATPLTGGAEVAIKVLRPGPDAERELAVLRAVAHPHVVRLHRSLVLDDGRLALVLDLVDGGTLASLVAGRGHLSPGEVVTVIAPLAQAIAELHADGVQHGDLAPGNVLFDRTGRPVLADLGTSRLTGEPRDEVFGTAGYVDPVVLIGGPAGPAADVYGLGALAWLALTGAPPESAALRGPLAAAAPAALMEAVEAAVDPDPSRRPEPGALAAALRAACDPQPVWRTGAGPDVGGLTHRIRVLAAAGAVEQPARRHRARRVTSRRLVTALGLATLAAVIAIGGWWWWPTAAGSDARPPTVAGSASTSVGRERPPPTSVKSVTLAPPPRMAQKPVPAAARTPASPPTAPGGHASGRAPTTAEVVTVVRDLTRRRAALFADPRRPVTDVAVRGSPAAVADAAALARLRSAGLAYSHLSLGVDRVRVVAASPGRVVVDLLSSATAYDVVDVSGLAVAGSAAQRATPVRLVIDRTPQGWRVHSVRQG